MTNSSRLASLLAIGGGLALAVAAPAPAFANCGALGSSYQSQDISNFDTTPQPRRPARVRVKKDAAKVAAAVPAAAAPCSASAAPASCGASCGASQAACGPRA